MKIRKKVKGNFVDFTIIVKNPQMICVLNYESSHFVLTLKSVVGYNAKL